MAKKPKPTYDCVKCPSMCCSAYDYIEVTRSDMVLMAQHLDIPLKKFIKEYTDPSELGTSESERQLKRVSDKMFDVTCIFLNQQTRLCGIHEARPDVCRDWNGEVQGKKRVCGFWDFLKFIERDQGKDFKPLIQIEKRVWKKKDRPKLD